MNRLARGGGNSNCRWQGILIVADRSGLFSYLIEVDRKGYSGDCANKERARMGATGFIYGSRITSRVVILCTVDPQG